MKIAVGIIHGIGQQTATFANSFIGRLKRRFARNLRGIHPDPAEQLVCRAIVWSDVIDHAERELWKRVRSGGVMDFQAVRRFFISSGADAVAYQQNPGDRHIYDGIHSVVASHLRELAKETDPAAPLCIIAHSLGTVIMSNFFYDLQAHIASQKDLISIETMMEMRGTPLEHAETLAHFYTLGSPIAVWSLRYANARPAFGLPLRFPPEKLHSHYPNIEPEWVNIYDRDDFVGFPLRSLNQGYAKSVKEDREVNVSYNPVTSGLPTAHMAYWRSAAVINPIADALARTWRDINIDHPLED